jgi:hypothetical protein
LPTPDKITEKDVRDHDNLFTLKSARQVKTTNRLVVNLQSVQFSILVIEFHFQLKDVLLPLMQLILINPDIN